MPKFSRILICFLLIGSLLCGCNIQLPDIVVDAGDLTISLPGYFDNYMEEEVEGFFMYGYDELTIGGFRDDFSNYETIPTAEEYAAMIIADSEVEATMENIEGLVAFTFPKLVNDKDSYTYLTVVFVGSEAFWTIQAGLRTLNYNVTRDRLIEIIKTTVVK